MNSCEINAGTELDAVARNLMESRQIADYHKAFELARIANPKLSFAYDGKRVAPGGAGFAEVYKAFLRKHARNDDGRMQVKVYDRDDDDRGEVHAYDRDIEDVISEAKQAVSESGGDVRL